MSGQTIRQKYMRSFTGLDRYSVGYARMVVMGYIGQIVLSIYFGHLLLQQPSTGLKVTAIALLAIFVGTRFRGINNIVHECSHNSFTDNRAENTRLGKISACFMLSCYKDYCDEHLSHHRHLGDYEHDLDMQRVECLGIHDPLTPRTVIRHILRPLVGRHLPFYLGANLSDRDGVAYRWLKISLIAGAFLFLALEPVTAVVMVFVPFVWIYSAINYWTDCLDHGGLLGSNDELDASRNLPVPKLLRAVFFPRNDCFHLVHHLFPQIPTRHLGECHSVLRSDPIYASRPHAIGLDAVAPSRHRVVIPAE